MKIALAQLNFTIGDFDGNLAKMIAQIEKARKENVEIIVFSELAITGYYPYDLLENKEFIKKAEKSIHKLAKYCQNIAAVVGAPYSNKNASGKLLYNAAFFLSEGKVQFIQKKTLLPTYDVFDEYRHFEPNNQFDIVEFKGKKIALTICEDLWDEHPEFIELGKQSLYNISPMEKLATFQPDLVINISASPFSHQQEQWRKEILTAKARRFNVPIIYVNQIGSQTELIFDGGSLFIDNLGEIVHELKYFNEDFAIIDTEKTASKTLQPKTNNIEKTYNAIILGIKEYFNKTGFKKATLGLSGGIDSAVSVVLAVDALGAENVHVLLLPSKYSSDHSVEDAKLLAENLNIKYDIINIQDTVDQFDKGLKPIFKDAQPDVTEENIQARVRGLYLMALANKYRYILLNTSNKSEAAVGYGTLYGDMNGGISVLGDLYKLEVYQLARFINRDAEIIPNHTIIKAPSAELRPDQKDSDSLPPYEILDKVLYRFIEENLSKQEIVSEGFEEKVVERIIRLVYINEYKRRQAPPIIRVSNKAFGFGRRMPLVAEH